MSSSQPINYELTAETLPVAQFPSFVATHLEVITLRFWHGQTLLHKICLRQDATVETLQTLVAAGADVNAINNFGETPLMFAAKRGSAPFCRLLLDRGADRTICDKAGRNIIHHAVMGGSVYLVHYLHTIYDFELDVEDERKQTTLHIAASQGSLSMVNYLLRSCKCDGKKVDMFGNSALHHAAIYGHDQSETRVAADPLEKFRKNHRIVNRRAIDERSTHQLLSITSPPSQQVPVEQFNTIAQQVVYSILSYTGLTILDIKNEKGQTPLDVCTVRGSKQLATAQVFQYAVALKSRGNKILKHPWCLWLWYLVMPLTFFVVGYLISELLQTFVGWHSGSMFMSVVLVYIVYLFQVHSHRIKHVSRLGNPMHAGVFGAGLVGTFLVWLSALLPNLNFSDDYGNIVICGGALILVPPTYYCYWLLLTTDPGFIRLPSKGIPEISSTKLLLTTESSANRFCTYCDTVSSGNVKHCKLCERCVVHMDHHCLFLMKCVATRNHRLFTVFITIVNMNIILFLISAYRHFSFIYAGLKFTEIVEHMSVEHLFVLFVIILNLFSCIWGIFLLQWQLRLISQGHTYYDTISLEKDEFEKISVLSLRDRCLNLVHFCKGNKVPHKRAVLTV